MKTKTKINIMFYAFLGWFLAKIAILFYGIINFFVR